MTSVIAWKNRDQFGCDRVIQMVRYVPKGGIP